MTNELNIRRLTNSVSIEPGEQVSAPSTGSGAVERPTWNPADGASRHEEIIRAREEALAEQRALAEANDPINIRPVKLEGIVQRQQDQIKTLLKVLGKADD